MYNDDLTLEGIYKLTKSGELKWSINNKEAGSTIEYVTIYTISKEKYISLRLRINIYSLKSSTISIYYTNARDSLLIGTLKGSGLSDIINLLER